ncbi:MAG: TerB family tellurite resistance protein [Ignavibacteriales bacterium]|nr:MAG: TerB family tellurite resistance protein [Ignavibacteriaceae bacterium]MBW7872644.1 TerB family tellurite resistance protein [Ignavibacteria bacterium]MCZ2141802.1 TerB family tellurite resistance protein [Ignavibacteriales bacterium]MBV6444971.1 hypothetical protein [Ignavibacteriaceae bacterium]MBZ0196826.1 TerB family tellurite resistance protein [Ignavibacteriaceae bacterium]
MLTTIDKGNYLKGMMIVARLDNKLMDREKEIIRDIANRLGFSRDFYEEVLKNLMINEHIKNTPITFSSPVITRVFLREALKLAYIDSDLAPEELDWLQKTAEVNNINAKEFEAFVAEFIEKQKDEAA